jgi:hypothetical protein
LTPFLGLKKLFVNFTLAIVDVILILPFGGISLLINSSVSAAQPADKDGKRGSEICETF